jgi:spore maturation protein A
MMMLIVLNTASIQIIPTTVIAIRNSLGSSNPTSIVFPVWIATIFAAIARNYSNKNIDKSKTIQITKNNVI